LLFGEEPTSPPRPTPRTADGHPDLSGFWKGSLATSPVGNIGKDLPGFKLPLTAAGEAALQHNLTATVDPESLCIIGGIPRHSASALPFEIVQSSKRVAFLYMYTYFRVIPVDGRSHEPDPDPTFFGDKVGKWAVSDSSSAASASASRRRPSTCWQRSTLRLRHRDSLRA